MFSPWVLLVHLSWLPLLFVLFLKFYRGPYPLLAALLAYFLGSLMTVPALVLQTVWNLAVLPGELSSILELPLWFVPVEEGAKLFAALLAALALGYAPPRRAYLPLVLASALGFAATESVVAVSVFGLDVLPLRVLVAVPGHVIFSSYAAAGLVGRADGEISWWAFLAWWSLATVAHAGYNVVVLHDPLATPLDILGWLIALAGASVLLSVVRITGASGARRG